MSEVHSAVGSYVINALDGEELDEFEAHLAVCETCSREVGEFSETVAQLAMLSATPPPALRSTILAAIKEVRPLPPELPVQLPSDFMPFPGTPAGTSGAGPERTEAGAPDAPVALPTRGDTDRPIRADGGLAPVVDLGLRRARRRGRLLIVGIAAALVIAVGFGGYSYSLIQARNAQVSAAQQENLLETQLFSAKDLKVVAKTTVNGANVSFVSSKSLNKALFIGTNLPDAGSGKRYQLWTLTPGAQPDALFDGGASRKQWFSGSITDAEGLGVTIEPAGGSQQPTLPIQASTSI